MQPTDVQAYGADWSAREFSPDEVDRYPGVRLDFLFRYIGYPGNPKCISFYPGAYRRHVEAGRRVGLYHQIGYTDFSSGADAGRAHAQTALRDARSARVGWEDGESPIVACFDRRMAAFVRDNVFYAAIPLDVVRDYMSGFRSVLGSVAGFYGFEDTMAHAIAENWAPFTIQCGARSAHVFGIDAWQENNEQPRLLGTQTDRLELYRRIDEVFGNGDDMGTWNTPITLTADERRQYEPDWDGGDTTFMPDVWTKYSSFYAGLSLEGIKALQTMMTQSAARETAMLAALAALAANPSITKDMLRELINDAVRDHVRITGTVEISSVLPPVPQG